MHGGVVQGQEYRHVWLQGGEEWATVILKETLILLYRRPENAIAIQQLQSNGDELVIINQTAGMTPVGQDTCINYTFRMIIMTRIIGI